MSDLCLLVASLITQGRISGWLLANSISKLPTLFPNVITEEFSRWCNRMTIAEIENLGHTVFVSQVEVDRPEFSHQPRVVPMAMLGDTAMTWAPDRSISVPVPIPVRIQAPALPEPLFHDPIDVPIRPVSGAQLYQQRLAALIAGKTYTRLPVDSFHEHWLNATEQPTHNQWIDLLHQEARAMANGQGNARLTVLLGDSLSLWFPLELMSTDRFWLNQGISGDTTAGILQRLDAFRETRPDTIYVMAGINDLRRGATDAEVTNNLRLIMQRLRRAHPYAKIIIHSILPTRLAALPTTRIHRLNQAIAAMTQEEGVLFLNLQPVFMDETGILHRDLTTDGLHLNERGYRTWGNAMLSML
ncbi:GDSL-type esterase/lipase family protein [Thermocoleostomius sinensis]|uniref:GDSL-type esterase/lipase family protein n=1 Tax=Thermocoleostomius sinensis A174 TaxID=2016057 RepID=A0A9E8ZDT8_9CYAN|nr:GDSL-type esterase/lipase family protein [Thermocoleostomius sinensis]WAL61480.1 GDSL-type esterase/lipase family protein [Thermocoleostomius sinensis A174]